MGYRFRKTERCAFCPKPADSAEHAWPDWTLKRFRKPGQGGIIGQLADTDYLDPTQRALRFRCVCEIDCNIGWMKRLEDAAIPIAGSMMSDLSFTLDIPQQWTVAQWALKTAMVYEYVSDSRPLFYTDEERFGLRGASGSPSIPANTAVWLARNIGSDSFFTAANDIEISAISLKFQSYLTTLVFARLIVQVITIHSDKPSLVLPVPVSANRERWRDTYVRIWPSGRRALWPPPASIRSGAIMDFHRRFSDT